MTNMSRRRRRCRKWMRYADRLIKLSPKTLCTPGMNKAYNQLAIRYRRKRYRVGRTRGAAWISAEYLAARSAHDPNL